MEVAMAKRELEDTVGVVHIGDHARGEETGQPGVQKGGELRRRIAPDGGKELPVEVFCLLFDP